MANVNAIQTLVISQTLWRDKSKAGLTREKPETAAATSRAVRYIWIYVKAPVSLDLSKVIIQVSVDWSVTEKGIDFGCEDPVGYP